MECNNSELSLLITDDEEIAELNSNYRNINKPTDVLSFVLDEEMLGDVVISMPTTIRQSKEYQVTVFEEFLRLLIHGILHLLGYDHENVSPEEVKRMESKEAELFTYITSNLLKSSKE